MINRLGILVVTAVLSAVFGLTGERGQPITLQCIDDDFERKMTEQGGKAVTVLLQRLVSQGRKETVFTFKRKKNGFIDADEVWTDEEKYLDWKFEPTDDGRGITILDLKLDDDGRFLCRVQVSRSKLNVDVPFDISVLVRPKLEPPQTNVLVDAGNYGSYEEVAYCRAKEAKFTAAKIDWILSPAISSQDVRNVTTLDKVYRTVDSKSVLRLVPRKHYNGLGVTCRISHPTLPNPKTYQINVTVEYRPTTPMIKPYFKSDLLGCESQGNPAPRVDWVWFPTGSPQRKKQLQNTAKFELPTDGKKYNYTCIASNKHGTAERMISSAQLDRRQRFLEANLNIIVGAGVGTLVALILIGFAVCYCTLRSTRQRYKSGIKFPAEQMQLHPEVVPFRPSPPRSRPPPLNDSELADSDNDSFGDDVDLADDPFVRSHSILQSSQNYHQQQQPPFDQAMSDIYPTRSYRQPYDYQPPEISYSSQNTHRFKDIPSAFTYHNGDILPQSDSPIDARHYGEGGLSVSQLRGPEHDRRDETVVSARYDQQQHHHSHYQ